MKKHAPLLALAAVLAAVLGLVWWALGEVGSTSGGEDDAALEDGGTLRGSRGRRDRDLAPDPQPDDEPEPDEAPTTPPEDDVLRPPEGRGVLVGNVRSEEDLAPLAGVLLKVLHPTGEAAGWGLSNAQGDFEIGKLPANALLVLRVEAEGHLTGHCCAIVTSARGPTRSDLVLTRGPAIRITVTDGVDNEPQKGVEALLLRDDAQVATAISGPDGRIVLRAPEFGTFGLRLTSEGYAPTPLDRITLWPGQPEPRLARKVHPGGSLEVIVSGESGRRPVTVVVSGPGYEPVEGALDPNTGVVRFEKLPARTLLQVVATVPDGRQGMGNARLRGGIESRVEIELGPPARLGGTVADEDGRGLVDVVVVAGDLETRTDETGAFDFGGVAPGKYTPKVVAPGYLPAAEAITYAATSGKTTEVPLLMKEAGHAEIRGKVLDRGGRPVSGATVRVAPAGLRSVTGDQGTYRIARLPVGVAQEILVEADDYFLPEPGPLDTHTILPEETGVLDVDLVLQRFPETATDGEAEDDDTGELPSGGRTAARRARAAADAWTGFVHGTVRGYRTDPLPGTLVWVNGVAGYTDHEGRFRLEDVAFPLVGGGIEIQFRPPPGLHLPRRLFVEMPERAQRGVRDVEIRLPMRPVALLDVRGLQAVGGKGAPLRSFWYQSSATDSFLGVERKPGFLLHSVTYDGTWMHLPALPTRGLELGRLRHTLLRIVRSSTRGLLVSEDGWMPQAGLLGEVRPQFAVPHAAIRVVAPADYKGGRVRLEQTAPWTTTGTRLPGPPPEEAFAKIQVGRTVTQELARLSITVPNLAPGTWKVEVLPPRGSALPTLRKTSRTNATSTVRFKKRQTKTE